MFTLALTLAQCKLCLVLQSDHSVVVYQSDSLLTHEPLSVDIVAIQSHNQTAITRTTNILRTNEMLEQYVLIAVHNIVNHIGVYIILFIRWNKYCQ